MDPERLAPRIIPLPDYVTDEEYAKRMRAIEEMMAIREEAIANGESHSMTLDEINDEVYRRRCGDRSPSDLIPS